MAKEPKATGRLAKFEQAAMALFIKENPSSPSLFWGELSEETQKEYLHKIRIGMEKKNHEAWELWMEQRGSSHPEVQSWWELPKDTRELFLQKAADLRSEAITQEELKEWFGEDMPMNVFQFIFSDAPADMTMAEVKAQVRQMGADYRSPESLALQANEILNEAKRNGNIAPKLVNEINAWESRYLAYRRETDSGRA